MNTSARRPYTTTPNFIQRNIQTCSNPRRHTSAPPSTISVHGVSVLLCTKDNLKIRETTKHTRREATKINIKPETYFFERIEKNTAEKPTSHSIRHSGVRRTSIKSRDTVTIVKISKDNKSSTPEGRVKPKFEKARWFTNRETLALPVTSIPALEPILNISPNTIYRLTGKSIHGVDQWEAINRRSLEIERLLATMEKATKGQSKDIVPDNHLESKLSNGNEVNLDNSYQQVYQQHVDALTSVISQGQSGGKAEGTEVKRAKRKGPSKLEIKIDPTDQYITTLTQDVEDINLSEQVVDNRGDLTPVITYNHVSTVSTPEEFQYGKSISPGTSSRGSRSPSPLLEVPNPPGEISAKFPTV